MIAQQDNLCGRDLDVESANPGEAIFEKLVSGLYLGEVLLLTISPADETHSENHDVLVTLV